MENLLSYVDAHRDRYLKELMEFLAIPSVSTDAERTDEVRRCAHWLTDHMGAVGL